MHACGHDGHMAMALVLCRWLATHAGDLPRRVMVVFQPAEETSGGARRVCESGVFERYGVDRIFGFHLWPDLPKGMVASRPGPLLASSNECALALALEGKTVTVVDMLPRDQFVTEMPIFNKADLMAQLEEKGVKLYGSRKIQSIENGVHTLDADGNEQFFPADSVVNALGVKPDDALGKKLLAKYGSGQVILVGDCTAKGGTYYRANHEAYHAAMRI